MLIELFGLPGSGKTYFSLKNKDKYELVKLNSSFEKYFHFIKFLFKRPLLSLYFLKELILNIETFDKSYFKILIHKFFGTYINTFAKYEKYLKIKISSKKYLIDEGFAQLIFVIYDRKNKNLSKTLSLVKKFICEIYIFEIAEKQRKFRLKKRGEIPRIHFGTNYYKKWEKSSFKTFKEIIKLIEKRKYNYKFIK